MPRIGQATGGTPLAVTQEDFLVMHVISLLCYVLNFHLNCLSGQSILKCYTEIFFETLCTAPTFIEVQSAHYGITASSDGDPTTCNAKQKECWEDVQDVKPTYYQTILDACNGNQICVDLIADWAQVPKCNYILSDYVEIFYTCISNT